MKIGILCKKNNKKSFNLGNCQKESLPVSRAFDLDACFISCTNAKFD